MKKTMFQHRKNNYFDYLVDNGFGDIADNVATFDQFRKLVDLAQDLNGVDSKDAVIWDLVTLLMDLNDPRIQ